MFAHQVRGGPVFCIADGVILGAFHRLTDIYIATLYYHLGKIFNESQSCNVYVSLAPKETKLLTFLSFIIRTHPRGDSPLGPKKT